MKRILSVLLVIVLVVSSSGSVAVAQTDIPAGMVGVPDANVSEDVPLDSSPALRGSDLEGSVMASDHAESLEVIVTTPDRASDYLNTSTELTGSNGISLILQDDVHSAGREVAIDAGAVRDALGYTPERLYGTHEDGEQWSRAIEYQGGMLIFEVPHFSSNSVTFSSEISISGTYTTGSSVSYDVSSLDSVDNFSVEFTGMSTTETDTFSVPEDGSSSDPIAGEEIPSSAAVDISWDTQGIDKNSGPTMDPSDNTYSVTYSGVTDPGQVQSTFAATVAGSFDFRVIDRSDGSVMGEKTYTSGTSTTATFDFSSQTTPDGIKLVWDNSDNDYKIDIQGHEVEKLPPDSVDATVDGSTKTWTSEGSKTISLNNDETVDASTSISGGGSGVSTTVSYQETSYSENPTVEVNGDITSYSGTLAPGETATVTPPADAVQESNIVNVSLADTTDAPDRAVEMDYRHTAQDEQIVEYEGTKWTEGYNFSKTFASDRSAASLTIPFENEVVEIESIETRTNGGPWTSVSEDNYDLNNTELTVHFGAVNGGDEVAVRTTGQQVVSVNSTITVLDPTAPGDRLDSKVRIDEWNDNSSISVGRTEDSGRIHYTYQKSWDGADDYVEITDDGTQQLYLPGAGELSDFRVRTVPVRANARSGEVEISVQNPSTTEPSFYVSPGATQNDDVEYTLLTASDGEEYILRSETNNVVHDSAEASSPVTLVDDDSEELLVIEQDSTTASEDDGPSMVGIGPAQIGTDSPLNSVPVILLVGAGILVALAVIYRRLGWSIRDATGPVPVDPVFALAAGLIAFVVIDYVGGGVLTSALATNIEQIGSGISQIVPLLGIGGAALLGYWLYQNYILGNSGGGGSDDDSSRTIVIRDGGGNE
ncbi:hypothetical protein [Haloplanus salilacus]|uniref:hypothetical protein n=1 Tax=Haloplanus salilacus TaxID=2949994 RepID=UPI0030D0C17A